MATREPESRALATARNSAARLDASALGNALSDRSRSESRTPYLASTALTSLATFVSVSSFTVLSSSVYGHISPGEALADLLYMGEYGIERPTRTAPQVSPLGHGQVQVQVHALRKVRGDDVITCLATASAAQRPASCSRR